MAEMKNLTGLNTNLAVSNKWIAMFAIEDVLGKNYKNLELHLTRFSIPQQEMQTETVSYRGYSVERPTKVINPSTKELTLEYLIDDQWYNYKCLYKWMSGLYGTFNPTTDVSDVTTIMATQYLPLHIYLIDNFKKKIISFLFTQSWIKMFNDISLEAGNSDVVTHSFTLCYDTFTIEDV